MRRVRRVVIGAFLVALPVAAIVALLAIGLR
jgi:hypothetical protein